MKKLILASVLSATLCFAPAAQLFAQTTTHRFGGGLGLREWLNILLWHRAFISAHADTDSCSSMGFLPAHT